MPKLCIRPQLSTFAFTVRETAKTVSFLKGMTQAGGSSFLRIVFAMHVRSKPPTDLSRSEHGAVWVVNLDEAAESEELVTLLPLYLTSGLIWHFAAQT